jgi:hypothetical protein
MKFKAGTLHGAGTLVVRCVLIAILIGLVGYVAVTGVKASRIRSAGDWIQAELQSDRRFRAVSVQALPSKGFVLLYGTVRSDEDLQRVRELARHAKSPVGINVTVEQ